MSTQADNRRGGSHLAQMYGVGLMAFVLFLSTLVGLPVLPQLSLELGAEVAQIPLVVSAALATVVIAQFFTGILADRYSRRTLILVGALLGALSSLLCVVAADWTQLAILRVMGGIAAAIAMPALLAVTASLGQDQPGKFCGILRSSQGLSYVVGPVLGGIFPLVSLRTPFMVDGLLSLLAFLAALVLIKDTSRVKAEHNLNLFRGFRFVLAHQRVYLYLLLGVSGLFGFGIFYSFIPTAAHLGGLAAWQIGLILGGGAVIFSLGSYTAGALSDRFGRGRFVIAAQVLIVLAGIGLVFRHDFAGLALFYGLFCISDAITYLLCFVYAAEVFAADYLGTAMGVFDSLMDLSLFVGPLVAVLVYQSTFQMAPVFLLAVAPAGLAFLTALMWLPRPSVSKEAMSGSN